MYFKQFPKIFYPTGTTQTLVPDIFRRVHLDKFFKNRTNLFGYYVTDGMTPELVAKQQYGSTFFHWIVLLTNDIVDVEREWPKGSNDLIDYVKDKYGSNNSTDVHHYVLTSDKTIVVDWDATKAVDGTYTAVTNTQYEEDLNEKKSQIYLIRPELVTAIRKQFKTLIS